MGVNDSRQTGLDEAVQVGSTAAKVVEGAAKAGKITAAAANGAALGGPYGAAASVAIAAARHGKKILLALLPPHQSVCRLTASPHRGSHWICENPNAFLHGKALGACKYRKLLRKKVQPDKFRMHLLLMAVVLRQLVSNLTPPYQAARSRNS